MDVKFLLKHILQNQITIGDDKENDNYNDDDNDDDDVDTNAKTF